MQFVVSKTEPVILQSSKEAAKQSANRKEQFKKAHRLAVMPFNEAEEKSQFSKRHPSRTMAAKSAPWNRQSRKVKWDSCSSKISASEKSTPLYSV